MYLRSTPRRNKDGTEVRYLQLAHNEWDPAEARSAVQVVYNFGREDSANREALAAAGRVASPGSWTRARPWPRPPRAWSSPSRGRCGGATCWTRCGSGSASGRRLRRLLDGPAAGRRGRAGAVRAGREPGAGPVLEAGRRPLGQRATCTSTACGDQRRRLLPGDGLAARDHAATWRSKVFDRSPTCSTSRSTCCSSTPPPPTSRPEDEDEPVRPATSTACRWPDGNSRQRARTRDDGEPAGFRTCGKSKDHRDDLPQVVIGMAVTRDGIPVRVWCWPGNTADSALIRQVKDDMRDWSPVEGHLGRRPRLHLRGEPPLPAQGRRQLHHRGEAPLRLRRRAGRPVPAGPLQGRRAGTCEVKEVRIADDERFVICFNPEAAERDAAVRARMIAQLEEIDRRTPTSSAATSAPSCAA